MTTVAGSWLTLVFAAGVLLMLWVSEDLADASARIPRIVLFATGFCLLLQLASELLSAWKRSPETQASAEYDRLGRTVSAIAWLALLLSLTWLFGVAPASSVFCLAWLRWHAGESWRVSLLMSAGLGLVLWAVFSALPATGLYTGVLWPFL